MHAHLRSRFRDVFVANARCDIVAVEQHAIGFISGAVPERSCVLSVSRTSAASSLKAVEVSSAFRASARYIAPVSRLRNPKRRARCAASVLLPAPAGPSIAITGRRRAIGRWTRHFFLPLFLTVFFPCGRFVREAVVDPLPPRGFFAQNGLAPLFSLDAVSDPSFGSTALGPAFFAPGSGGRSLGPRFGPSSSWHTALAADRAA